MSKKLEGKVAVITGGNSGVGLATARRPNDLIRRPRIDQTTLSRNVDRMCKRMTRART